MKIANTLAFLYTSFEILYEIKNSENIFRIEISVKSSGYIQDKKNYEGGKIISFFKQVYISGY